MKATLILTAALILMGLLQFHCSRQTYGNNYQVGEGICDGPLGAFNVLVSPTSGAAQPYAVSIIPINLAQDGAIAQIYVAMSNPPMYQELQSNVVLQTGQEIFAGFLMASMVNGSTPYTTLIITPPTGDPNLFASTAQANVCQLPAPSNGYSLPPPIPGY